MIDELPAEVVRQILGYLPTLSSITNVAKTNKKLNDVIRNGQNTIYHDYVQTQFPTIAANPPWQQTALRLSSRSRAWDRRAFIARECVPPDGNASVHLPARPRGAQTFGFMPVIDSYEVEAKKDSPGKEILVFGAGGRLQLRVRTTEDKPCKWSTLKFEGDQRPDHDILDIRLLRPHQNRNTLGESVFIRRANRELTLLHWYEKDDKWEAVTDFQVEPETAIDCVDIADDAEPLLAVCNSDSIRLFALHTSERLCHAETAVPLAETTTTKQRKRCARFLLDSRIAIAPQLLEGREAALIDIFDISSSGLLSTPLYPSQQLETRNASGADATSRVGANVLAKVDSGASTEAHGKDLLLSGWSDGIVRLYDLRLGPGPIKEFSDPVDDGQIFSLLPIGQERFLAGSHQNGCLKTFDMRMKSRVHNYTRPSFDMVSKKRGGGVKNTTHQAQSLVAPRSSRDINIFLALNVNRPAPWQPLARMQQLSERSRATRYSGSIYSLSSPSPSSPTVYVGIENHVVELSFQSSDDWWANRRDIFDSPDDRRAVLNLSCYERPRTGMESTDTVLLRKQRDLANCSEHNAPERTNRPPGWDERWYMENQQARGSRRASWRGTSGDKPFRPQNLAHRRRQ